MSCGTESSLLDEYLVHQVTLIPPTLKGEEVVYDEYGEPVAGTTRLSRVRCFIERKTRRVLDSNNRVVVYSFSILFDGKTSVENEWEVQDGYNNFGQQLLVKGRVASVDYTQSIDEGIISRTAMIEEI